MLAVKEQSQAIGYFLDSMSGQGLHLAKWTCGGHWDPAEMHELDDGQVRDMDYWFHGTYALTDSTRCDDPALTLAMESIEKVLARHFGIDLNVIEDEKRQMLEDIRASRDLREGIAPTPG